MHVLGRSLLALTLVLGASAATSAAAQTVSTADLTRLQDTLRNADRDVAAVRKTDPQRARRLQDDLDALRDEVTYLRVKARKETVSQAEYDDVRDRIQSVRAQARGQSGSAFPASGDRRSGGISGGTVETGSTDVSGARDNEPSVVRNGAPGEIPVGQELDVRLQTPLNSGTAAVEDRFEATTLVDLYQGERVLIPAGSVLRGVVSSVDPATRTDRKGSLTLTFDQMTVEGRSYPIRATVAQALESEGVRGEVGRIGAGAGVGAIIGGLLGGVKGAIAGILIGGGGTMMATPGKDLDLPAGTVLRVRFDSSVNLR